MALPRDRARDLAPLGYEIHLFDEQIAGGGMMRAARFRFSILRNAVLDEEVNYILIWVSTRISKPTDPACANCWIKTDDAIFVGTGAPRGRDLDIPGREAGKANIHIGIEWLASVAFEHTHAIEVIVLGGGRHSH